MSYSLRVKIKKLYYQGSLKQKERDRILNALDIAERSTGHWEPIGYDGYADGSSVIDEWECSECGEEHYGDSDTLTPFCPNCGADMRTESEDI